MGYVLRETAFPGAILHFRPALAPIQEAHPARKPSKPIAVDVVAQLSKPGG
jgi:hypothetical protein